MTFMLHLTKLHFQTSWGWHRRCVVWVNLRQNFSVMNINKSHQRSKLTDHHLRSILRTATTNQKLDFDALAKKGDQHHCHWHQWVLHHAVKKTTLFQMFSCLKNAHVNFGRFSFSISKISINVWKCVFFHFKNLI